MKKLCLLPLLLLFYWTTAQSTGSVEADSSHTLPEVENTTERIRSFHADIIIDTAGWVRVTETIRVYASGNQIRRGIFRSLPYYRKDRMGRKQRIDVEVTAVRRDGQEEAYHTEKKDDHFVVYIGQKDVILDPGEYTYQVTYQSRGHVGFFDGFDELYWNVTGNEWSFAIEEATATLHLPAGAHIRSTACYTGVSGSTASNCNIRINGDSIPVFTATGLGASEGLTVAVSWQAGLIRRPPPPGFLQQLWDYKNIILALAGLFYILRYLYITWKKHGRDAAKITVVPTFKPPFDWSPSMLRYLHKRNIDARVFAVAIVNMAVKKQLRIKQQPGRSSGFTLEKTEEARNTLSEEEKSVHRKLFSKAKNQVVGNENYKVFGEARDVLEKELKAAVKLKDYYNPNTRQLWQATWRTLVVLLAFLLLEETAGSIILLIALVFGTLSLAGLVFGIKCLRNRAVIEGIFLVFFCFPFVLATSFMLVTELHHFGSLALVYTVVLVAAYILYVILIPAYTAEGRKMEAAIKGFRLYLATAEEHRLNMVTPPERTPELFERLLPYAIALDLENAWGQKFSNILEQAHYAPGWYSGDVPMYGALATSLPDRLGRSLEHARRNPYAGSGSSSRSSGSSGSSGSSSWSSGSSGGGSSGGGGGGGGGGGW